MDKLQLVYGNPDYDGPLSSGELFGVTVYWTPDDRLHAVDFPVNYRQSIRINGDREK